MVTNVLSHVRSVHMTRSGRVRAAASTTARESAHWGTTQRERGMEVSELSVVLVSVCLCVCVSVCLCVCVSVCLLSVVCCLLSVVGAQEGCTVSCLLFCACVHFSVP